MSGIPASGGAQSHTAFGEERRRRRIPCAMREQGTKRGLSTDFELLGVASGTPCFRVWA